MSKRLVVLNKYFLRECQIFCVKRFSPYELPHPNGLQIDHWSGPNGTSLIHSTRSKRFIQFSLHTRDTTKAREYYGKFLDLWKDGDPGLPEVEDAKRSMAGLEN